MNVSTELEQILSLMGASTERCVFVFETTEVTEDLFCHKQEVSLEKCI